MKIIADTASLISPEAGQAMGVTIIPVSVAVNDKTYRDYLDINGEAFLDLIARGGIPTSSQPAIGDILEVLESGEEEMMYLTVGDGLSGSYQTALAARNLAPNPDRIHIINSQTLAGPLHYLVEKALKLKTQGLDLAKISQELNRCIESSVSFVIPEDFAFLQRSGRLTPLTAKIGGALKLLPVLTQSKDRTRITPIAIKRGWNTALETIYQRLQSLEIGENHRISVCHAGTPAKAVKILEQIRERFRTVETELLELSPALITHGGPGCIVIQAIRK